MEAREGPFRLGVQSRGFRRGSPFSTGKAASFAVRKAGIAPLLLKEGLLMNGQTTDMHWGVPPTAIWQIAHILEIPKAGLGADATPQAGPSVGIVNLKVAPCPVSDSPQMRPPWQSVNRTRLCLEYGAAGRRLQRPSRSHKARRCSRSIVQYSRLDFRTDPLESLTWRKRTISCTPSKRGESSRPFGASCSGSTRRWRRRG